MDVKYFAFLDYRKLKKYSWKECGFDYKKELIDWAITNPEYFDENNPPPRLYFPYSPEELGIIPYTEQEIGYMEAELSYSFPGAFKELLFLFGGEIFNYMNDSIPRIRAYNSGGKLMKIDLEEDIKNIKYLQNVLKQYFVKNLKIEPLSHLLLINYSEGEFGCIISNKDDRCLFYNQPEDCLVNTNTYNLVDASKENGPFGLYFRREREEEFFTSYTSKKSAKKLCYELKKKSVFKGISVIEDDLGVQITNPLKSVSIYILIEYDNMPYFHFKHKRKNRKYDHEFPSLKNTERIIFNYSFRDVVERKDELIEKIIHRLNLINYLKDVNV